MRRHETWAWLVLIWLLLPLTAQATESAIDNARVRLLPGGLPAAGYFELRNAGETRHVLVGAQSPAFERVMMHESIENDGMAAMRPVAQLTLEPGERVHFAPGGYHLMFMERTRPLKVGDELSVTLEFADGRRVPVTFRVVPPTMAGGK